MTRVSDLVSQRATVLRPAELPSRSRGGGAHTTPLVTAARGATAFLNGITTFEPGASIGHHTHNVAESVMVVEGEAVVDIDGTRSTLHTGDTTFVPANIPHHFENISDSATMKIFWTYGSLDATRTLIDSGQYGRVDSEGSGDSSAQASIVREIAVIDVRPGHEDLFEAAVSLAVPLFQSAKGARTFTLDRSYEHRGRYHLTVSWETVEDHTVGFRESPAFLQWRALIGEHVTATPRVEHVSNVLTGF